MKKRRESSGWEDAGIRWDFDDVVIARGTTETDEFQVLSVEVFGTDFGSFGRGLVDPFWIGTFPAEELKHDRVDSLGRSPRWRTCFLSSSF